LVERFGPSTSVPNVCVRNKQLHHDDGHSLFQNQSLSNYFDDGQIQRMTNHRHQDHAEPATPTPTRTTIDQRVHIPTTQRLFEVYPVHDSNPQAHSNHVNPSILQIVAIIARTTHQAALLTAAAAAAATVAAAITTTITTTIINIMALQLPAQPEDGIDLAVVAPTTATTATAAAAATTTVAVVVDHEVAVLASTTTTTTTTAVVEVIVIVIIVIIVTIINNNHTNQSHHTYVKQNEKGNQAHQLL